MVRVEEDYDRKVLFFTLKNSTSLIQHKHINLLQSAIFFLLAQVTVLLYIKWSLIENSFSSCSMEFPYYKYSADDARLLYNDNLVQEQRHWTCRHYLSILSSLFPVCVTDITIFLSQSQRNLKMFLSLGQVLQLPFPSSSLNSKFTLNMAVTSASLMLDVDRPIDLGRRRKLVANEYKIFATYKKLKGKN